MSISIVTKPSEYKILVVDDEIDVFKVTELSLKNLYFQGHGLQFLYAKSGQEAIEIMQANPDIAVILLDVVMETNTAGLDACNTIRNILKNSIVRIVLRTGQPGVAPEKQVIDDYDIDGYLPKAELTSTRLYSTVRTAIKSWNDLVELERHRSHLGLVHDCVVSLHAFEPLENCLRTVLETAVSLCPSSLAISQLETFSQEGNPQSCFLYLSTEKDATIANTEALMCADQINTNPLTQKSEGPVALDNGLFIPFALHRQLGSGWLFLAGVHPDELTIKSLTLLSSHAANALYSSVAFELLANREGPVFETMAV